MAIKIARDWLASWQSSNLQPLSPVAKALAQQIAAQRGVDFDFDRLKLMEVDSLPEGQQYRVFGNVVAIPFDRLYHTYRVGSVDKHGKPNDHDEIFFRNMIADVLDRHQRVGSLNATVSCVSDLFTAAMKGKAMPRSFDTGVDIASSPQPD